MESKRSVLSDNHKRLSLGSIKQNTKKINGSYNNINVFCRFRPVTDPKDFCPFYEIYDDKKTINVEAPNDVIQRNNISDKYIFSHVFKEKESQETVFNKTLVPVLVRLFLEGKNALVFTYGVTNAGKTYTIVGDKNNPGVLINAINLLVDIKESLLESDKKKDMNIEQMNMNSQLLTPNATQTKSLHENMQINPELRKIKKKNLFFNRLNIFDDDTLKSVIISDIDIALQCFEIYNDEVYDLFSSAAKNRKKLHIKEVNKKLVLEDVITNSINSHSDGQNLIEKCLKNRSLMSTALNSTSSRSHCIYKIILTFKLESEDEVVRIEKCLNIVDLAGSERARRTENTGKNLKEANKINQSLSCLGRCLAALKDKTIPPYRETKLTRYLSEFFVEDSNIIMIANINPIINDFEESIRVLNYTAIAREVKPVISRLDQNLNVTRSVKKLYRESTSTFMVDTNSFLSKDNTINTLNTTAKDVAIKSMNKKIDMLIEENKEKEKKIDEILEILKDIKSNFDAKETEPILKFPKFEDADSLVDVKSEGHQKYKHKIPFKHNESSTLIKYIKDVGTSMSPNKLYTSSNRFNSYNRNRAKNKKRSFSVHKNNLKNKYSKTYSSDEDYNTIKNLPLFKRHKDYEKYTTKQLCKIIETKEHEEKKKIDKIATEFLSNNDIIKED